MIEQGLESNWKLYEEREEKWLKAKVPGTVYTDLLAHGKMKDPFFRDQEDETCTLMEQDYIYETTFIPENALWQCEDIFLHFAGIDTVADIYLNEQLIGHTENMHRTWEFDVRHSLQREENRLRVVLRSPLKYIVAAYKKYGNIGNEDTYEGFMHLRKAHYMFGWDWGAHLPDAGIFRAVSLIGMEGARLNSVYITQLHKENVVELSLTVEPQNREYIVSITAPDGKTERYEASPDKIVIQKPQLWWPNGLGEQPLYDVMVELKQQEKTVDTWKNTIGLRRMTMERKKDAWGESFAHEVNGNTLFAMGADYIPEDHLIGRTTKERTRRLLEDCKEANFNSIRVWGGGYYPEDWFYDLCDELGLIVWQDFMFACSVYELTPEFEANITQEFIDNIKRIRHHACLGLWCGNNEMEMFVKEGCWVTKPSEVKDYLLMYERIIPQVLSTYDPNTFYWPASPSSGGSFDEPNDPNRGDVHYWQVWHGNKPFSEYRKHFFRYASEFGFQSFPSVKTIDTFAKEEDKNPFSYIMEKHQRNYGANGKIMNYLQQTYRYPTDFSMFVYASQLLQAEAIRYGVEHFRRNRGRCMGAVYWQLNDCWPVISWSSIDYYGRWKALHYYAKRFFAPVMISCQEEGMMSAEANMNRQHFRFEKSIHLNVTNETRQEKEVTIQWETRNAKAEVLRQECEVRNIDPLSSIWLEKELLSEIDIFGEYVSYRVKENGATCSEGTVIFSYPKYFCYEDPQLTYHIEGNELVVSACSYAKSVEILNESEDLVLSDNYFDLNGDTKRIKILRGNADNLKLRSVYHIK